MEFTCHQTYILYTPESSAQNVTTYQHTLRYKPGWKAFIFNLHKENITLLAASVKTRQVISRDSYDCLPKADRRRVPRALLPMQLVKPAI